MSEVAIQVSLAGLILGVMGFMYRSLIVIKNNHLKHLDMKVDEVKDLLTKTNEKVDRHIQWHLDNR